MTNLLWHAEPTKDPTVDLTVDLTVEHTVHATPLGQVKQFGNDLKLGSVYFNLSLRPFVSSCIWSCPCWLIIATRFWKLGLPHLRISPPLLSSSYPFSFPSLQCYGNERVNRLNWPKVDLL